LAGVWLSHSLSSAPMPPRRRLWSLAYTTVRFTWFCPAVLNSVLAAGQSRAPLPQLPVRGRLAVVAVSKSVDSPQDRGSHESQHRCWLSRPCQMPMSCVRGNVDEVVCAALRKYMMYARASDRNHAPSPQPPRHPINVWPAHPGIGPFRQFLAILFHEMT